MSEHTVGKVRRLAEDVEALRAEEAAEKKVAMMLKRTKMFIVELLKRLMMGDSFSLSPLWPQGEGKEKGSFFPKSWAQERNLNIIFASEWSTFKLSMEFSVVLLFKTYLNFLLLIFHICFWMFSLQLSAHERSHQRSRSAQPLVKLAIIFVAKVLDLICPHTFPPYSTIQVLWVFILYWSLMLIF